jgi:hypothetical protein
MAIVRNTVLNQVEITEGGTVQVRLALVLEENGMVLHRRWHRVAIPLDIDVAAQMAEVSRDLESMGEWPVSEADVARIAEYHALSKKHAEG